MKKRKIPFLLMAFILLVAPLSACDDSSSGKTYEFFNHLDVEQTVYHSSVTQLEGEVVASNSYHNLVALKTSECSIGGNVSDTYKVYDLETLEVVHTSTSSYSYGDQYPSKISDIDLSNYPLIGLTRVHYVSRYDEYLEETVYEPEYRYTYYLPGESNSLAYDLESSTARVNYKENLFECRVGDNVYWISSDFEILRKYPSFVVSGYESPWFDAEYNDYLYAWELSETTRKIQVFNKEGVCQVEYDYPQTVAMANPFLLNNGNIFVQEFLYAQEGEEYDYEYAFAYESYKFKINNKIIDYKTGEVTKIKFDYLVNDLSSYYTQENDGSDFPFILKEGKENQAYLVKIINKAPANKTDYVVLDNSMNIVYTVKNDSLAESTYGYSEVYAMKDAYVGTIEYGNDSVSYLFDYDGNIKCGIPENLVDYTDKYIVTENAIFDYSLNKVYDFETSDLVKGTDGSFEVEVHGNEVIMTVINAYTGSDYETYRFDGSKPALIADGIDTEADYLDSCYVVEDEVNDTVFVYAYSGEVLLIYQSTAPTTENVETFEFDKADLISAEVGGNKICYVIK